MLAKAYRTICGEEMKKPPPEEIPDTCICGLDWHPWCKLHGDDSEDYKKWDREIARDKAKVIDAKPEDKRK